MKKFIALFIVLAVLAPVVFAQDAGITFSGWGRGVFAPIQFVDPDPGDGKAYAGVGKWNPYPRVGFSVIGNAEQVGFRADLFVLENGLSGSTSMDPTDLDMSSDAFEAFDLDTSSSGEGVPVGDFAYIWAKPWNFLQVSVGKFNDDTLRGKIGDTNFSGGVTLGMKDDDAIFTRFQGTGLGAEVALTPIEGLYIAAVVNAGNFPVPGEGYEGTPVKNVYEKIQVGAGYEIANIGHARAQFVGNSGIIEDTTVGSASAQRVEVAFALTAVENLLVDLGAKIWFPATKELDTTTDDLFDTKTAANDASSWNPIGISVGAKYDLDAFSIMGRIDTQVAGSYTTGTGAAKTENTRGFYLNAHLVPSYNLGFATVGADIGFQLNPALTTKVGDTSTTDDKGGIGFGLGAWIEKGLGNGSIKTGIGVQLPTDIGEDAAGTKTKNPLVLTIPVILEYLF